MARPPPESCAAGPGLLLARPWNSGEVPDAVRPRMENAGVPLIDLCMFGPVAAGGSYVPGPGETLRDCSKMLLPRPRTLDAMAEGRVDSNAGAPIPDWTGGPCTPDVNSVGSGDVKRPPME